MCVYVCVSTKAHRQQIREERRVKENEEEWKSLTYTSLSLQPSSRHANVAKSICPRRPWEINLAHPDREVQWMATTEDKKKPSQAMSYLNNYSQGSGMKCRRVTGWPSKRSEVNSSVCGQTAWPQANSSSCRLSVKTQEYWPGAAFRCRQNTERHLWPGGASSFHLASRRKHACD